MASLEQSRSRIPDAWSVKLTLQKLKKEFKNLKQSSQNIALSKGTNFAKITESLHEKC